MKTMDPGHYYFLDEYSGFDPEETVGTDQALYFMHRLGKRYPGNEGSPYNGTNCQEVIRALIARSQYLYSQINCDETFSIIEHLREALYLFEWRASRIHYLEDEFLNLIQKTTVPIEQLPPCKTCGHIVCKHKNRK